MKRRLLAGYLGVALFVLVAMEVPLGVQNQRNERHDVEVKVERDATVLSSYAEDAVQTRNRTALADVARYSFSYARSAGTRVVIVDTRGTALIDTSSRVTGTENFASRPEVAKALKGQIASGTRYSTTLGTRLLYVAVPLGSGGVTGGAVRITYPMASVEARIVRYWLLLGGIALIVLSGAALVGVRLARFVTGPLRGLEQAAAAFGAGDLEARALLTGGPPEVRSLARAFNETASKLGLLVRSQQEFIADASHELRTPLTALQLRLETLPPDRNVEAALREVERLSSLVEGLLSLARADATGTSSERVDVAAVARERVETWTPLAAERDVLLVATTDDVAIACAGADRVAQVIDNLVSNALGHGPPGTTVSVSVDASSADWVALYVRDQGPGMTADQRERAFDRFWRANTEPGGSGLGLAIVRRLVEADGGTVTLEQVSAGGLEAAVRLRACVMP